MAVQTIDKALFDAYFDQVLIEKRGYFKELIREIIEEKVANGKSSKDAPVLSSTAQELVDTTMPSAAAMPDAQFDEISASSIDGTTMPSAAAMPDAHDPFAREQLTQHFERILKEDHNLLLRLAQ